MPEPAPPLLLDLDGTLADTLDDISASSNHVRADFGLPPLAADQVRPMIGQGVLVLLERALAELGPFEPHRERAWSVYQEHHRAQCTVHVRPYPGAREALDRWHASGRRMAVVTNKPESFAAAILDHLALTEYLPVLIGGDTVAKKKPDPEPVWAALDRLGVPRRPALLAGDSPGDIRAGRAAGIGTIAALYGFCPADELRAAGADRYWVGFGKDSG